MPDIHRSIADSYDEVPYHSIALPQTDPERLASLATLWGLTPASTGACRVLEIGCASGGNLLPLACRNPGSDYVGIDISPVQIRAGMARVEALQLDNVALHVRDVSNCDDLGVFDYIICHGVYSWVPPEVQTAILTLCARALSARGLAYISYNTYPGWKFQEVVRDAMIFWSGDATSSAERLARGRGLVDFLAGAASEDSTVRKVMQERASTWKDERTDYLLHEYLEADNRPCYLRDFAARAAAAGLAYVGDAIPATMSWAGLKPDVTRAVRAECGHDRIKAEQILDFIVGRKFRQSMLTPASGGHALSFEPTVERLSPLHFGGPIQREAADRGSGMASQAYRSLGGRRFTLSSPAAIAAADAIGRAWPGTVAWSGLIDAVRDGCPAHLQAQELTAFLAFAVECDVVRTRMTPVGRPRSATPDLVAPRHVRQMASFAARDASPAIANAWHDPVAIDEIELLLLPKLDGTRRADELVNVLLDAVERRRLRLSDGGQPLSGDALVDAARRLVDAAITSLRGKLLLD